MVYLLIAKHKMVVKVGFTKDIARREREYNTHDSDFELIDILEGTRADERDFHERMVEDLGFERIGRSEKMVIKGMTKKRIRELGFKIFC